MVALDEALRHAGATMVRRGERLVARDFGSIAGEEAAILHDAGLAVRSDRVTLEITGTPVGVDAVVEGVAGTVPDGGAVHARDAWWFRVDDDRVLVRCEAANVEGSRTALLASANGLRSVSVADVSETILGLQLIGPKAAAILDAVGLPMPTPVAGASHDGVDLVLASEESDHLELLVPDYGALAVWTALHRAGAALGLANVGVAAVDRLSAREHLGDHWREVAR